MLQHIGMKFHNLAQRRAYQLPLASSRRVGLATSAYRCECWHTVIFISSLVTAHKKVCRPKQQLGPENEPFKMKTRSFVFEMREDGNLSAYYKSGKRRNVQEWIIGKSFMVQHRFSSPQDDFCTWVFHLRVRLLVLVLFAKHEFTNVIRLSFRQIKVEGSPHSPYSPLNNTNQHTNKRISLTLFLFF